MLNLFQALYSNRWSATTYAYAQWHSTIHLQVLRESFHTEGGSGPAFADPYESQAVQVHYMLQMFLAVCPPPSTYEDSHEYTAIRVSGLPEEVQAEQSLKFPHAVTRRRNERFANGTVWPDFKYGLS